MVLSTDCAVIYVDFAPQWPFIKREEAYCDVV